jgi:DNA-directed RNA polymerase
VDYLQPSKITNFVSALYKLYRLRTEQRNVEEVKAHPVLLKLFGPQKFQKIRFLTPELPMLVPSVPWLSPNHGGFLLETANFVRAGVDSSSSPLEASVLESRLSQAYPVFDCLNQLGSTPWIINNPILDLVNIYFHF